MNKEYTFATNDTGGKKDLGATNTYRYVTTTSVPNSNSGTYTFPAGSTGATYDMGTTNTIRKVNAANVYAQGVADGKNGAKGSISITGATGATYQAVNLGFQPSFVAVYINDYYIFLSASNPTKTVRDASSLDRSFNIRITSTGFEYIVNYYGISGTLYYDAVK